MKDFFITIIDVFAILPPGLALLVAVVLFPPLTIQLAHALPSTLAPTTADYVSAIASVAHACCGLGNAQVVALSIATGIAAYLLGFVMRLSSIKTAHKFTVRFFWKRRPSAKGDGKELSWLEDLRERAEKLQDVMKGLIWDQEFWAQMQTAMQVPASPGGVDDGAHLFPFVKRYLRTASTNLCSEMERIEAEVRLAAGLMVPLGLLTLDGAVSLVYDGGWMGGALLVCSGWCLLVICRTFPKRRIREVLYVYYCAILEMKANQASHVAPSADARGAEETTTACE